MDILFGISERDKLWNEEFSRELLSCSIKENLNDSSELVLIPMD